MPGVVPLEVVWENPKREEVRIGRSEGIRGAGSQEEQGKKAKV